MAVALTVLSFPKEPSALDIAASEEAADVTGNTFLNVGRTGFWCANASGAPIEVTFNATSDCDDGFSHDSVVDVPNGFAGFIAHSLDAGRFSNPTTNLVTVTYESVTSLTVKAVKFQD